jgi:hypothetical protein
MLAMAGSGALIAARLPERGTAVIGLITCYLVVTSWHAARSRDGHAGHWEQASLAAALALCTTMVIFSLQAGTSPEGRLDSLPAAAHYPFALIAGIAAVMDLSVLIRGRLEPRQRIARHLWRMCAALLIAALSFFLGQQDEFPEALRGHFLWLLPPLLVAATMLYWILRMRLGRGLKRRPPSLAAAPVSGGRSAPR